MRKDFARTAPFPYFGGKSSIIAEVWARLGSPKQYIEPFCGSAAMLLGAPQVAALEVVNDLNGFIANFWRAVQSNATTVAQFADYPVSHVDLGARHVWLMGRREHLAGALQDPNWPGDPKIAGWWLWGQCSWIGSGWCEWRGQTPHVSNAGRGVQARGKIPHVSDAGRGVQVRGKIPHVSDARMWTSGGRTAREWLHALAERIERVRLMHGAWHRCLNHHYGKTQTALFFDPPYKKYEKLYGFDTSVASDVEVWCRENQGLRIALCGHYGDYDLPGWFVGRWSRVRLTYGGAKTKDQEAVYFSPACLIPKE